MKQKGLFRNLLGLSLALMLGLFVSSCGDDATPPTIKIYVTPEEGFTVNIVAEASSDVTSWSWDYGNGESSNVEGNHEFTYTEGGEYTIKCTVTNADGLTATDEETVTIATIEELLARQWQLADAGNNGVGFEITPELPISMPLTNILEMLNGMITDDDMQYDFTLEYNDTYSFNANGSVSISANGTALAPWVYAGNEGVVVKGTCSAAGFIAVGLEDPKAATYKVHKHESFTINTVKDLNQDGTPDDINGDGSITGDDIIPVKFEDKTYIVFSNGGYLGLKDNPISDGTNLYESIAVINSISASEMNVTVFVHSSVNSDGIGFYQPCYFVNMTFKAVQ